MEDRPENSFAEVRVVAIEILVFHKHRRSIVVVVQRILDIFLDRIRDAVSREANSTNPGKVELSPGARLPSGVGQTAVPLDCRLDRPSLGGKAPVTGTTST